MKIKLQILGTGCPKCRIARRARRTRRAGARSRLRAREGHRDREDLEFGVVATPALGVDGGILVSGTCRRRPGLKELHRYSGSAPGVSARERALPPLCVANSRAADGGGSRAAGGDRLRVRSAARRPSRVHPLAVRALAEIGIDISGSRSKSVDEVDPPTWTP